MGLSVSTKIGFENKDLLKTAARNILMNSGAKNGSANDFVKFSIFDSNEGNINPQLSVLKASTQISLNNSLNETLKYLKNHANKKVVKMPVFGELWQILETNNESSEQEHYKGELFDFEIDKNAKNIFAA